LAQKLTLATRKTEYLGLILPQFNALFNLGSCLTIEFKK
jgi:hypothetical protein